MSRDGGGREYRVCPSLSRVRWLFPADYKAVRREGIRQLLRPRSLRGRVLKTLVSAGGIPGQKIFLEEEPLHHLEGEFSRALEGVGVYVAFYVGTPGAYRKITAQAITAQGETLAFAKIASAPLARDDVEAEQLNLRRLEEVGLLRGRVPRVLHHFDWQGNKVLLMTSGPGQPGSAELSSSHADFYKDMFAAFAKEGKFGESPMMDRMAERSARLGPKLSGSLSGLIERSLIHLGEDLGSVSMPLSIAHRDFAPWNTRFGPKGLFVFDWDRLEDGVVPLYDLFHFQAIQVVLLGTRRELPDRRFLYEILDSVWPGGRKHLPGLYLAYLLDMTLFYAEARVVAPDAGDDRVLNWFAGRIDRFLETGLSL